ncbi:FUSC family protein [Pseudomonas aeruginosa]|uniref:FUSC family protein n=1 Tax=Pseudomonas aeruginosa TaxID=287 RepID=UPI0034D35120
MRRTPSLVLKIFGYSKKFKIYWVSDKERILHSCKTALALVIAMWICMRLQLPSPRTAMVSVVILMMHQQVGAVIARGFYRVIGMLAGAAAGLLLIVLFPQQPLPFFLTLAAWVGVCVWGAAYYRNYQSYGFVLTGYATAITAVPSWSDPHSVFETAVNTGFEVAVGAITAASVSALVLPRHVTAALFAAGQRHASSFLAFLRKILGGELTSSDANQMHLKMLSERAQIENLRSGAVFEDPGVLLSNPLMAGLNSDFLAATANFHSIRQIRGRAARSGNSTALLAIDPLFGEVEALLPAPADNGMLPLEQFQYLNERLQAFLPQLPERIQHYRSYLPQGDQQSLQTFNSAAMALYFALIELQSYIEGFLAVRQPAHLQSYQRIQQANQRAPRITVSSANALVARAAGLRAAIAVLLVAAFWIASGWTAGASSVVAVTITSALFAVFPQPAAASRQILLGCLTGGMAAFAYTFFILPKIDGFLMLAVTIAPFIMVGAYVNSFMPTAVMGLGFMIYFCFITNMSNTTNYDPTALLDTLFAMLMGISAAWMAFTVVVPHGLDWVIQAYLRQIRRLVSDSACREPLQDGSLLSFESNMRDFTIQIAARPLEGPVGRQNLLGWAFAALEVGRSVIRLRQEGAHWQHVLPEQWKPLERRWRKALANLFDKVNADHHRVALEAIREAIALLQVPARFDSSRQTVALYQIAALLRSIELSLMDDTLPLLPTTSDTPASASASTPKDSAV